ncbi:cupin domain-containing protein [Aliiglaciecola sp. 2_MG-2023]|uniref:cupin domain-containing protein n=1 Tax=Alteromonadaceae TaxID=72275 RepID=UPI0026E12462|nr:MULTISPECIES: cupin domain-containing protein [unclassified Aliiglaciecola]MDO6711811.1 cupin domain-containing protein [Aliiglaciecola sp. 2_MG-2023]MDO6753015.1 cupin domain-containing protein [Aliiglaciecola sp. 1_MG-2023]
MYKLNIPNKQHFLTEYWQKKPLVIRKAFSDFVDPLDEHELAGLAQEEEVDSRIISKKQGKWSNSPGPFSDFTPYCIGDWSLLVQSVDHYIPEAKMLLDSFDFIPNWRVDDLMVSYSEANGGVGPHVDQYDVFIIQGRGSRRWQVGANKHHDSIQPAKNLKQITGFDPIIDEVLEPGDLIYIPPGFPHNGVAITSCLNYSVGFRAPTQRELLDGFVDYAQAKNLFNLRYSDPDLTLRDSRFEIKPSEIEKLKNMFNQMINSVHFDDFIATYFTETKDVDMYEADLTENYSLNEIVNLLDSGVSFERKLDTKIIQQKVRLNNKYQMVTWINQHRINVESEHESMLFKMLNSSVLDKQTKINYADGLIFNQILAKLVNAGGWFPDI